jgi:O-antigen/teichoic acid export membrane protein
MLAERLKTLLKHSSVYSLSWVASSAAGVLLLPVYTAYLTPADYGIVQILDYSANILKIAIVSGQVAAVYRFLGEAGSEAERRQVVGTGYLYVAVVGMLVLGAVVAVHPALSRAILGAEAPYTYIRLALGVLFADLLILVPTAYFAANQRPMVYLLYSLGKLALGIAANLYFIVGKGLGAEGMLLGNLVSSAVFALLMSAHLAALNGLPFGRELLGKMLRFGLPLVPGVVASSLTQSADRYFLRAFQGLDQVGIYSLGFKFPFLLFTLIGTSFKLAWSANMMYEVAKEPDAKWQFSRVATYYFAGFAFLMYCMAVLSTSIIGLLAADEYQEAARVIPVVCIAMALFSFHQFVSIGAYVTGRTGVLPAGYIAALLVCLGLNWVVVPRWGYMGAAWVTVATYVTFNAVNHALCRRFYRIEFEGVRMLKVTAAAVGLFLIYRALPHHGPWVELAQQALFVPLFPAALLALGFFERGEMDRIKAVVARRARPSDHEPADP